MSTSGTRFIVFAILAFCFPATSSPQANYETGGCKQEAKVRKAIFEEAAKTPLSVRRLEITGNLTVRHHEFVKRMTGANEGDIFARPAFEKAVRRVALMKAIYPITVRNTELHLDRASGDVDIVICVKERIRQ